MLKWSSRRAKRCVSTLCERSGKLESLEEDLKHLECQNSFQVRSTYVSLLKLCGNAGALEQGRRVHHHIVSAGLADDGFLGDHLLQMYGKCGSLEDASSIFSALPRKTVFSWNFIIAAYAKNRHGRRALDLFREMDSQSFKPDAVTLATVLGACCTMRELEQGRQIHARIRSGEFPSGIAVETVLVKMYARCGHLREAREVFDGIEVRDVICWNSMIAAYAQSGDMRSAQALYEEMEERGLKPNDTTFAGMIGSCGSLEEGKLIHSKAIARGLQSSTIVQNSLVSMYARCDRLDVARKVFNETRAKTVVSWNAMIAAYAQKGEAEKALELYELMNLEPNEVTYASVFAACSSLGLETGRRIHERIRGTRFESNVTVATAIVTLYCKCGKAESAREVFDRMQHKNVVSWNAMLGGYSQNGRDRDSLELYERMVSERVQPDDVTVVILLGVCANLRLLELGREMHRVSVAQKLESNIRVQNALISMYGKCNELELAREIFNRIKVHDVVSWTSLIVGFAQQGRNSEALELFKRMEREGVEADNITLTSVLSACAVSGDFELGKELHHRLTKKKGSLVDDVLVAALINMYVKCGRLDLSCEVFDACEKKTLVVWNSMMAAYALEGRSREALETFERMDSEGLIPDEATLSCALSACADLKSLEDGQAFHVQVVASGITSAVVQNALITMYSSCGQLRSARKVFNRMETRDLVSWTAIISAYVQGSRPKKALQLYRKMILEGVFPTEITMLAVIAACTAMEALWEGVVIHALLTSSGLFISSDALQASLISMYAKCRRLDIAGEVFRHTSHLEHGVNSWNSMLAALAQLGFPGRAIVLYREMNQLGLKPNEGSFASILSACSVAGDALEGHRVHSQIRYSRHHESLNLGTALLHMYSKCGKVEAAWHLFQEMEELDVVAWNAMIAGLSQNGYHWHALELFDEMVSRGVEPDCFTVTNVLSVCANLRLLDYGRKIYDRALRRDLEPETAVECALFTLYAKCGKLDIAAELFEEIRMRNLVCWHGIVAAFAHHGYGEETLWYYRRFKVEGYNALEPTFLCVFLACGHAGLLDEGRWYFQSMIEEGLEPGFDHYVCMVNLFARAGKLAEAEELLGSMPFCPNDVAWTTLLAACRTHGDLKRARRAADEAVKADRQESAPYVLLSNIYAAAGCFPRSMKSRLAPEGLPETGKEVEKDLEEDLSGEAVLTR